MSSRRPPIEREDGDAKRGGVLGSSSSTDLGGSGLDPPHLEARRPEFLGKSAPSQLLGFPDLLDPLSDCGTHRQDVSESETVVQPFQTRKRKRAISLGVPNLLLPTMEDFEHWSEQLGLKFDEVLDAAGVADPKDARATRVRMRKGGAPRIRETLLKQLSEAERKRKRPTEIGSLMLGIEEWTTLGAELAGIDADGFRRLLDSLRERVATAKKTQAADDAFRSVK